MGVSTGCRRGRIWNDSSSSTGVDRGPRPAAATRRARHRGLPEGPHRPGQRHEGRPAAVDGLAAVLRPSDTLVIWRIDRLGRNLRDLIDIVTTLQARGVGVRSLSNGLVDTTTALAAARARGRKGGRKPKITPELIGKAQRMYDARQFTMAEIAASCAVTPMTIYRNIRTGEPTPCPTPGDPGPSDPSFKIATSANGCADHPRPRRPSVR